jgi:hypothetical protein
LPSGEEYKKQTGSAIRSLKFHFILPVFFSFQLYSNLRRRFRGDYFSLRNKNAKKRGKKEQILKKKFAPFRVFRGPKI